MSEDADGIVPRIVDCDVHHDFASWMDLMPYVAPGLRHRLDDPRGRGLARHGFRKVGSLYGRVPHPPSGRPNTDPIFVRDALQARGVDRAILTGDNFSLGVQPNADLAAAIARGINDWTLDRWVRPFELFRGSILIAPQDPHQAAEEIDRLGTDPGMVQVLMGSASDAPFGRRAFHPIYAACERHNLPLALHIGGEGAGISSPSTPVGHPNTYLEWYSALPQSYMAHVTSMVSEGVFERFPQLRVVLIEGGVTWLPHLKWRFEKNFKAVRAETPWLRRLPSEYIHSHFRLTTYPLEELPRADAWPAILEMIQARQNLLFSTGFPFWEQGDPFEMIEVVPTDIRDRVLAGNAIELYGERLTAGRTAERV